MSMCLWLNLFCTNLSFLWFWWLDIRHIGVWVVDKSLKTVSPPHWPFGSFDRTCESTTVYVCVCVWCTRACVCQNGMSCCHSSVQAAHHKMHHRPLWQNIQINCCQAAETPSAAIFIWRAEDPDMQSWQVMLEHLWETDDKNQEKPDPRHNNTYHY